MPPYMYNCLNLCLGAVVLYTFVLSGLYRTINFVY